MKIKATIPAASTDNGKMHDGNKEQIEFWAIVARKDGKFVQPITVRVWMGRSSSASVKYASIWADGKGVWLAGSGSAGGGGYCRTSAAVGDAIRAAGIKLDKSISGGGLSAVESALEAIARALGYRSFTIVRG